MIIFFTTDGAVGHYLVCLVKCQERILATSLVNTMPNSNTVTFPDKFCFEGLDGDFKVRYYFYLLIFTVFNIRNIKYNVFRSLLKCTLYKHQKKFCLTILNIILLRRRYEYVFLKY